MTDRAAEKLPLRHLAVLFAIMLVLILVFVMANSHQVDISVMGAHGHLPLGLRFFSLQCWGSCGSSSPGPPG